MILEIVVDNNYNVGTQNRREMKTTMDNIEKVSRYIIEQLVTNGEFDKETPLLSSVERTVEMFKEIDNG